MSKKSIFIAVGIICVLLVGVAGYKHFFYGEAAEEKFVEEEFTDYEVEFEHTYNATSAQSHFYTFNVKVEKEDLGTCEVRVWKNSGSFWRDKTGEPESEASMWHTYCPAFISGAESKIEWVPDVLDCERAYNMDTLLPQYEDGRVYIIMRQDTTIIGLIAFEMPIVEGEGTSDVEYGEVEVKKAVVFPKVDGKYQDVTIEYINEMLEDIYED